MIYIVKKMMQAFFLPPSLILLLLVISLILIYLKRKWGKRLLLVTIIIYYFLSISPVSRLLLIGLENQYPYIDVPPQKIKYVVVLDGGTINSQSTLPPTSRLSSSSNARVLEGIRLYNQIKDGYLVLSGGGSSLFLHKESPCLRLKDMAILLGVEEQRIILECQSRDTYEEAKELKKILGSKPFLLVTSAFHMTRSMYIFKKLGLKAVAAPSDFKAQGQKRYTFFDFVPSSSNLMNSSLAINEYFGLVFYRFYK